MKKPIIPLIFFLLSLTSCSILNNDSNIYSKKEWINAYKKYTILQTMKKSGIDLNKDNSGVIQFEILGANTQTVKEIDSLSTKYSQEILSSASYFEGKPIIIMSLDLYTSKRLDQTAKNSFKK